MRKLFFILIVISLIVSCKKENNKEAREILPLKVGNYWLYKYIYVEESETTLVDTFRMEVVAQKNDTFYLTGSLFVLDEDLTQEETIKVFLLDTFYLTYTNDEPDTQLILPLKIKKSWRVNEDFVAEIISLEDININNTRYSECWLINYQNEDGDIQKSLWLKEKIGIVKFKKEEDEEVTVLELKEYNIKN
ncbi:MAG: hypothetical protein N2323_01950 [candidate division WOR-3 bacterium]|nr:hypothetical protein [candidate division WOR-3 bacterium]MCX7836710.1 hypothetical protein [candidate division WOR-3 bacterium]MDW8113453.1 hypothetical protein [candidate division WOR-3 bacterium]